jgi:hypothetical protein
MVQARRRPLTHRSSSPLAILHRARSSSPRAFCLKIRFTSPGRLAQHAPHSLLHPSAAAAAAAGVLRAAKAGKTRAGCAVTGVKHAGVFQWGPPRLVWCKPASPAPTGRQGGAGAPRRPTWERRTGAAELDYCSQECTTAWCTPPSCCAHTLPRRYALSAPTLSRIKPIAGGPCLLLHLHHAGPCPSMRVVHASLCCLPGLQGAGSGTARKPPNMGRGCRRVTR